MVCLALVFLFWKKSSYQVVLSSIYMIFRHLNQNECICYLMSQPPDFKYPDSQHPYDWLIQFPVSYFRSSNLAIEGKSRGKRNSQKLREGASRRAASWDSPNSSQGEVLFQSIQQGTWHPQMISACSSRAQIIYSKKWQLFFFNFMIHLEIPWVSHCSWICVIQIDLLEWSYQI